MAHQIAAFALVQLVGVAIEMEPPPSSFLCTELQM